MSDEPTSPRRGRPRRSGPPLEALSTRVPQSDYDRIVKLAAAREMSVASVVRQLLILRLPQAER